MIKGIRGELDEVGLAQHSAPIHANARNEHGGDRRQEPLESAVFPPQGENNDRLDVPFDTVVHGVLNSGDQRGIWTRLDECAIPVLICAEHRLVELHGMPNVSIPVLSI